VRHLYLSDSLEFDYFIPSLVNHTGFLTTLPTYSYFPLQTFFSSSEVACLSNTIEAEIRHMNLAPLYRKQFKRQLEWLKQGTVSQLEMALYPGEEVGGRASQGALMNFDRWYSWTSQPSYGWEELCFPCFVRTGTSIVIGTSHSVTEEIL